MQKLATGVDMAKATFVVAVWIDDQAVELGTYANEATGFVRLQTHLDELCLEHDLSTIHLVVEPTGGYELALVAFAHEHEWQVSLPNPKQVRDWAKGTGQRAKTDRQDAQVLARYGAKRQPAPQRPVPAMVSELDSLLKRRADLEQMIHKAPRGYPNRLSELRRRPDIADAVVPSLEQVIEALEEALAEVEQAIEEHVQQHAELRRERKRLLAVPGIGVKNVLPLLVLLFRWHTLTAGEGSAKGLTAYVGLDPQLYESGSSVYQRTTISKFDAYFFASI